MATAATAVADTDQDTARQDERVLKLATMMRYALVAVLAFTLVWFLPALRNATVAGWEVPMPTWWTDIAALTPLLALIRFRDPADRESGVTVEFDLKVLGSLYLFMAVAGAVREGLWLLLPAMVFSFAVFAGIWYTNRRARARG
ncbi:hypothetical protein ACIQI8_09385 [Streptomyces sp. NPDC092369]|uniref:hypothetical protein n=1 Tax=Streptomyces sp. NPDC092369 TaxID=3366015 RepID=UPI0037F9795E